MSPSAPSKKPNRQYTPEEKAAFFRRLDRGGTIRAVAAELGLNVEACYRWRHETGQSTARGKDRTYSAEDKAEFFRLLALHGNVSAVAKMLGFVRVTCYKWAHQAGIFTGESADEYLRSWAPPLLRLSATCSLSGSRLLAPLNIRVERRCS
jgi:IS30 family transposase